MECLNMIGGDCISHLHIILFIFSLVAMGFVLGYVMSQLMREINVVQVKKRIKKGDAKMVMCTKSGCIVKRVCGDEYFCLKHREQWREFCDEAGYTNLTPVDYFLKDLKKFQGGKK